MCMYTLIDTNEQQYVYANMLPFKHSHIGRYRCIPNYKRTHTYKRTFTQKKKTIQIYSKLSIHLSKSRESPHGVVVNVLDLDIIISNLELQFLGSVLFWINTLGKRMNYIVHPLVIG